MHRVLPVVERTLRAGRAEVDAERKDLAVPDEAGRLGNLRGGDEVQRPQLVVVAPPSPVADVVGDTPKSLRLAMFRPSPRS